MTLGESHRNDRVARFYRLPSGRWYGEVIGPGLAFCAMSNPSLDVVMAFLMRRMATVAVGACPNGCEATT